MEIWVIGYPWKHLFGRSKKRSNKRSKKRSKKCVLRMEIWAIGYPVSTFVNYEFTWHYF